jgi:nicotinate phosphoribosyltransferase
MDHSTFGHVGPATLGLFTDLYELTMMQGYREASHEPRATFSLFFRELPPDRGYLVAAGLEQVVHYIETVEFGDRTLRFLRDQGFGDSFLEYLAEFEFTGDVRAVPEGTPVFPDEPLVEVTAPITEAQLFETMLLNQVGFQSLVATKAARMRDVVERAGDGQTLVDFGSRRAHGTDAGVKAARAAYVGGFDGTSNVAAAELFDVPVYGTMAHSWIQSFPTEREAFRAFLDTYGGDTMLLVDTYDTIRGVELAVEVAEELGVDLRGVRLDSGALAELSRQVTQRRPSLDVFVSSGMDEYAIRTFFRDGGRADGFGPGTALATSADAPVLDIVYKLVAVERDGEMRPSMKLSSGKVTYPGAKSVVRIRGDDGTAAYDVLSVADEDGPGTDLLEPVFEDGSRVSPVPSLEDVRARTLDAIGHLPTSVRRVTDPDSYEVRVSDGLTDLTEQTRAGLDAERGAR